MSRPRLSLRISRLGGEGHAEKRDFAFLDKIHPNRIKSLKAWMEKNKYDGQGKSVLKGPADLKAMAAKMQAQQNGK
ncbi:hypothetical protein CLAFUW4_04469 [Fulvia fulva]|uniref:Uncharacterized protein n=1 Tax=Passalora fulva TaxID=5499 RepID=A0A9Q8P8F8_PASFU|nr:uncharacterized protein CLAFUR5_04434 [Fulvia fulva]KAK4626535.1 hypothetical protein CLAFUR4_04455 [Fulvia fulva]KAK4628338.1 hypothetical protein CLAFUR0_04458 [Fulvia fulva]UJO17098.1 hypothetical protein CLAFUR5_04434 [Fulvia fulva]WPV13562.1 hypothetical protein CLAFUW4_04469 [Fulvia fulva]WPV28440.1 hypothetical protein CLAFUW7_04461 [Fulvia fulva]